MTKTRTWPKYAFILLILLFTVCGLIFNSCRQISQKTANEMFLKEHPTYNIVHSETGEGWDGVVNYHFEYKKPHDETLYKEAWTFVRQDNGDWKVTGRWIP